MNENAMHRHIFISGISYSGSTLLNLCLGSLPDCVGVDETNWLVPKPGLSIPNFSRTTRAEKSLCRLCGDSCEFFTKTFSENLQSDPRNWASKMGALFNSPIVITAEKEPTYLDTIYKDSDYDMIILFRHPLTQYKSFEARPWRSETEDIIYKRWYRVYSSHFNRKISGKKIFIELENFLQKPEQFMQALTKSLNIPYSNNFLEYWKTDHHYIGGNFNLAKLIRENPKKLPLRAPQPNYSRTKIQYIKKNHPDTWKLYNSMKLHHIKL